MQAGTASVPPVSVASMSAWSGVPQLGDAGLRLGGGVRGIWVGVGVGGLDVGPAVCGVGVGFWLGGGVGAGFALGPPICGGDELRGGVALAVGAGDGVARTELVAAIAVGATVTVGDGAARTSVGLATGMDAAAGSGVWVVDATLGVDDAPAVSANGTVESAEADVGIGALRAALPGPGIGATMAHKVRTSKPFTSHRTRSSHWGDRVDRDRCRTEGSCDSPSSRGRMSFPSVAAA
jgi:hypothetical protein